MCQNKAKEVNIRTARLPIGKYLANFPTRKVLTVNQVFEILIKWAEARDWEVALSHVMPRRKFNAAGKRGKTKGADEDEEQEQGEGPQQVVAEEDQPEGEQNNTREAAVEQQVKEDHGDASTLEVTT